MCLCCSLRAYVEAHWQEFEQLETGTSPSPASQPPAAAAASASAASSGSLSALRRQSLDARAGSSSVSSLESSAGYLSCHKLVLESINQASHLCQRSMDGEKLWFTLLDRFVQLQRQLTDATSSDGSQQQLQQPQPRQRGGGSGAAGTVLSGTMPARVISHLHTALIGYVRSVLHSMMGFVALPSILRKITTDHQADELRDFRDTIVSMLDTYSYEQSILRTATQLMNADKFWQVKQLCIKQASAFCPRSDYCDLCHLPLSDGSLTLRIRLFDCGHTVHDACLKKQTAPHCPLCHQQQQQTGRKSAAEADHCTARRLPRIPLTDLTLSRPGFLSSLHPPCSVSGHAVSRLAQRRRRRPEPARPPLCWSTRRRRRRPRSRAAAL